MPHANSPTSLEQPTINGVRLYVNDGLLGPADVGLLQASSPDEPLDELRRRYETNGYLFLKGLLPRQDVLNARGAYFTSLEPTGVLKPGTSPVEGLFNPNASPAEYPGIGAGSLDGLGPGSGSPSERFVRAALDTHTEPWYCGSDEQGIQGFCNHPVLRDFVARFTDWGSDTLTVRRTLLRNNTPGNKAIGVHYDQSFMRYGEPTAVTAWVPMGDIRLEGGGLIYLQGGEKIGEEIEAEFTRKAKAAGMDDEETRNAFNANMMSSGFLSEEPRSFSREHGSKWLVSAYEAGDVVLHRAHQIHASTINHDTDGRIRLGTDLRFVNSARPYDERWNKDFELGDGL